MTANFTGPLEDRIAIREVLESYADAVNRVDEALWASLWVEDCHWDLSHYPELGIVSGKDAVVALWAGAMPHYPKLSFMVMPGMIRVDGDRAEVRAYISEIYEEPGTLKDKRARACYNDVFVKRDGQWLIQSRSFTIIHQT
ncbi:nuclear transport factor 2 family protein [Sphingobium algorifonticola]|uniref:Nuclear transport factor 2 family protein n=1 Tax=Sphingobium algorifonticola TaxID=2008318 RepID=A0A437JBN0_9SPHN|nr:nuclear transport factor 2 family protein [Sphingobium algorifonticola]RVT43274.1 nuclear transport factor 2 family protein [Sphingobium algorifonticola]